MSQVQRRREDQQHKANLMALTAKVLAGQTVSDFMSDFGYRQHQCQPAEVLHVEELVKRRQAALKFPVVRHDQPQHRQRQVRPGDTAGRPNLVPQPVSLTSPKRILA